MEKIKDDDNDNDDDHKNTTNKTSPLDIYPHKSVPTLWFTNTTVGKTSNQVI